MNCGDISKGEGYPGDTGWPRSNAALKLAFAGHRSRARINPPGGVLMARPQPPVPPESDPQREIKLICMNNLLASTEESAYFKDLLSRFLLVSAGFIAAYAPGRTAAQIIGKTDFDFFSYEHAAAALKDEQQIIRTGRPIVGKLERETYKGRADSWVSTTKMPLRDERGRIIGTFGISRVVPAAQVR
jgi:PAS fold